MEMPWYEAALRWYAVLVVATWVWAPLVALLCARLPDRGASLARPIALLATVYPVWLVASTGLLPYSTPLLVLVVAAAGAIGWGAMLRRRAVDSRWLRQMAVWEGIGAAAFGAGVWLRGFTPAIVGTEKPMEIAFLAASSRTATMPPTDPWFSGEVINYYYLGYVLFGSAGKVAGIAASTAFNLAVPTILSMSFVAAAGIGFNVVRERLGPRIAAICAAIAAFAVVVAGNAYTATRLLASPVETVGAWWWDQRDGIGWRSSRIVCDGVRVANECGSPAETINEFPFFSVLLADVHPHLMALAFVLTAIGLAVSVWLRRPTARIAGDDWLRIAVVGWFVGSLYALNAWDFPTFLAVVLVAAWAGFRRSVRQFAIVGVVLAGCSLVAWAPFFLGYDPPVAVGPSDGSSPLAVPILAPASSTVGAWFGEHTSIGEYLTVFGSMYAAGLLFAVRVGSVRGHWPAWAFIAVVTFVGGAIVLAAPVLLVAGIPLTLLGCALATRRPTSIGWLAAGWLTVAFGLSVLVELFYLRDVFENRMNTLFKVYYQCWVLLAVAAPIAGTWLWATWRHRLPRLGLTAIAVVGVVVGAAYPVVATLQWIRDAGDWRGLDGIAYLETENPDELAGIRWLQSHALPSDVVLEAAGCSYEPNGRMPLSRVAAYTGVPTIIGWGHHHEVQWRRGQPELVAEIPVREDDVEAMFENPSGPVADRYRVSLIYVGSFERGTTRVRCPVAGPYPSVLEPGYPGDGWEQLFTQGDVAIYGRDTRPSTS